MGLLSDRYLGDRPKLYFIFNLIVMLILIAFMIFYFKTYCADSYNEGYDYCKAQYGHGEYIHIEYWDNGSIKNMTVKNKFWDLPFDPNLSWSSD